MHPWVIASVVCLISLTGPVSTDTALAWVEHRTKLEVMTVMSCSINISQDASLTWTLPNGKLARNDDKYVLTRSLLRIEKVSEGDSGLYICKVVGKKNTIIEVHTLNIGGPEYESITQKYYLNFVVGGVACAILCFLVLSTCLIYHFRYKDKKMTRLMNDDYDDDVSHDTRL